VELPGAARLPTSLAEAIHAFEAAPEASWTAYIRRAAQLAPDGASGGGVGARAAPLGVRAAPFGGTWRSRALFRSAPTRVGACRTLSKSCGAPVQDGCDRNPFDSLPCRAGLREVLKRDLGPALVTAFMAVRCPAQPDGSMHAAPPCPAPAKIPSSTCKNPSTSLFFHHTAKQHHHHATWQALRSASPSLPVRTRSWVSRRQRVVSRCKGHGSKVSQVYPALALLPCCSLYSQQRHALAAGAPRRGGALPGLHTRGVGRTAPHPLLTCASVPPWPMHHVLSV